MAGPDDTSLESNATGVGEVIIDPFALWQAFANSVKSGQLRTTFGDFLDAWREPIDVQVDKKMDLQAFGKGPDLFLKLPRPKRPDEFPSDLADRMKMDLERQFNLRNLARYVKTIDKGDPLEWEHKKVEIGGDLDARGHMKEVYAKIQGISLELGVDAVKSELAWRHRMLEIMQWERYFSAEIKADFSGPLWRHDPDTNPVGAQGRPTADGSEGEGDASGNASGSGSA